MFFEKIKSTSYFTVFVLLSTSDLASISPGLFFFSVFVYFYIFFTRSRCKFRKYHGSRRFTEQHFPSGDIKHLHARLGNKKQMAFLKIETHNNIGSEAANKITGVIFKNLSISVLHLVISWQETNYSNNVCAEMNSCYYSRKNHNKIL